ncbi:MAG: TylF/MycF/NovP-related O-methyltransferase [Ignavibacteriota bacterium]
MSVSTLAQRLFGRDIMVRISYAAYRCGFIVASPMHSLQKTRNHPVLFGEYIRAFLVGTPLPAKSTSIRFPARSPNSASSAVSSPGLSISPFPKRSCICSTPSQDSPSPISKTDHGTTAPAGLFSNTSIELVLSKMAHRQNCIVKPGLFPESAVDCQSEQFSFVSIDADLYTPIYEGLRFFYSRLSPGGYIFVHDYNNLAYQGA